MSVKQLALEWYELFSRYAEDLYPGRYTKVKCLELAEEATEIQLLAFIKNSTIVAHNYLYPEFHEIADMVGDSLGLSFLVRNKCAPRVDFGGVYFMGETAKIITGDATRVFVQDSPKELGCSLVSGTDHDWIHNWKQENPGGVLVTYINSSAYTKSISDFVATSRNTDKVILRASQMFPGKKILVLPDKFLGYVMKARAVALGVDAGLIDIYDHEHNTFHAACHIHEKLGEASVEVALDTHPDAELLIHPECGCASSCLAKLEEGIIPRGSAYFLSTEQMVEHARKSSSLKFIVATEKGMVYRLRKEIPNKQFFPISDTAECEFMKANTLTKLLRSLRDDVREIVICDDCCDPTNPYQDERVVHVSRTIALKAKEGIDRMLAIG